ncbi:MAG: O-antigen ligase family protein [Candidatus Omnitrophica bacterium]|nr:O-antigen ligase family protein [Candidatus Omnitrophota bacterium]
MIKGVFEGGSRAVLYFLIVFSPLALASNRPLPIAGIQALTLLGIAAAFLRDVYFRRAFTWRACPLNPLFAAFAGLVLIQVLLPQEIAGIHPSLYRRATWEALFKILTYLYIFWLTLSAFDNEKQISTLIRITFVVGLATSLVGIVQKISGAEKVLWFYQLKVDGSPYTGFFSTFVNANHFATFIGLVVFLLMGRFLYLNVRYASGKSKRHTEEKILLLFVLAVSSAALFLSLSRGGALIFVFSMLLFYCWILVEKRKKNTGLLLLVFFAATGSLLFWVGTENLMTELSSLLDPSQDVGSRVFVWKSAWKGLFLPHPVLGTGLGTFQYVFPAVKDEVLFGFWKHAHNDWLELLLETGVAGAALAVLATLIFVFLVRPLRFDEEDVYAKYNGSAAIAAVFFVLAMSVYDFPLKTTACAIYFTVTAALAVKFRQFRDARLGLGRVRTVPMHSRGRRLLATALFLALFGVFAAGMARPYLAQWMVRRGGKDSVAHLEKAIALDPLNADYHFWLGLALGNSAFYSSHRYDSVKMKQAFRSLEKALALNPSSAKYDYGFCYLAQKLGDVELAEKYFASTLAKSPGNPFFQIYFAIFCFNQAMTQQVLYGTDITTLDYFKKGLEAYRQAKKLMPYITLYDYKNSVAGYDRLNRLFHELGYIRPDVLL